MISRRAQNLKPSPTLALAAKAKELKASGHDVISLSVGEPDWDTFEIVKEAGIKAIEQGKTKYTPANGLPSLRQAIAQQTEHDLGVHYKADQVSVTAGAKFSIFAALQVLVDPGDEVIIPAPYWVSYPTMVELAEGRPVIVTCDKSTQYKLSAQNLEKAITPKTKMLILNSPSNPTGFMYSVEELKALAQVLKEHPQVVVLSDDIYNRLVFARDLAPHLLQVEASLQERTVIVNGVSKTYSMTGWRLGWAVGPTEVISAMNKYQSQSVSCASAFTQEAALVAIEKGGENLAQSMKLLQARRDFVVEALQGVAGIQVLPPQGAFYVWTDISSYLGKDFKGQTLKTSSDFSQALLEDQMVVAVPGIEFGLDGYLRISYALEQEKMAQAVSRLKEFVAQIEI